MTCLLLQPKGSRKGSGHCCIYCIETADQSDNNHHVKRQPAAKVLALQKQLHIALIKEFPPPILLPTSAVNTKKEAHAYLPHKPQQHKSPHRKEKPKAISAQESAPFR